jgi:hypothetical protein
LDTDDDRRDVRCPFICFPVRDLPRDPGCMTL